MPTATKTKASDQSPKVIEAIRNAAELLKALDVALLAEARGDAPLGLVDLVSSVGWGSERLDRERLRARRVVKSQQRAGTQKTREDMRKKIGEAEAAHLAERDRIAAFLESNPISVRCKACQKSTGVLTIDGVEMLEGAGLRDLRYNLSVAEGAVEYLQQPIVLPDHIAMRILDACHDQTRNTNKDELHEAESRQSVLAGLLKLRPCHVDYHTTEGKADSETAVHHIQRIERELAADFVIDGTRVLSERRVPVTDFSGRPTRQTIGVPAIDEKGWKKYCLPLAVEADALKPRIVELRAKVAKDREVVEKLKQHYVR